MKVLQNQAAQGDCWIKRIDDLPDGLKLAKPENGQWIVAHSETGHHHVIEAEGCEVLEDPQDSLTLYLRVMDDTAKRTGVVLRHLRDFDTHESIQIPPGTYRIRRQREYTPEGWRRVTD